ncbi:cyclase family protein [Leifsonia shinshuensis]|uniref:Cyclase family protein n=1 Tax=Leifsonia shinshuensis TaxID=150026 RepID=A0A7G6YDT9_9MICO|nr:cyclase family protein [Leifsonia shinshuensis]QNE36654.1 cyclase family protein [Leifsonia shinshuensis]
MRVIDLSHPVRGGMTVFPGDPAVSVEPAVTIAEAGVSVLSLHLGSHTGTHVDAPSHTVEGGATIDAVDLGRLIGPARVIDVSGLPPRTRIHMEDVRDDLSELAPGTIVLFRTGWSAHFDDPDYLDHPFLDAGIASALLDAGVTVVGVDALNPDETPRDDPAPGLPFHDVFLGAGGLIVENLTGLDRITASAPRFIGLPLPIAGGDGAPLRAVVVED